MSSELGAGGKGAGRDQEDDQIDARKYRGKKTDLSSSLGALTLGLDSDNYNMNHKCRGKCLVFNNMTFDPHTKLNARRGTGADVTDIYNCFRALEFNVIFRHNATKTEMLRELKKVASENHADNDCFVCVILTHGGDDGTLYGCDEKFRTELIFEPFLGDACISLAGKPKLFFIQACQGDRLDSDALVRTSIDSGEIAKIPFHADFLVAYSTIPGFYAWRNAYKGSWFIKALCYVLNKEAKQKELLEMLTVVNRRVAYDFEGYTPDDPSMHPKKQVPCITTMLTRKVYFRSKSNY